MKTNSRRKFIRNTSLTAAGIALTSSTIAKKQSIVSTAIGCAPTETLSLFGTISSVKSGNWSNPDTWGGKTPSSGDTPVILGGHTVVYDLETTTVSGVNIDLGATLTFASSKTCVLQSSKNVIVHGLLEMKPSSAVNVHTLRFVDVDENKFKGSTHDVLDSDVGLWVMKAGRVNLEGTQKTAWTRLAGSANKGTNSISLTKAAAGWKADDEIVVCPTQETHHLKQEEIELLFERKKLKAVNSTSLTLDSSLQYDHHKVEPAGSNKLWTAEVLNLTRNVCIEGTEKGKAHVFVRSTSPQTIRYVSFKNLGPRKEQTGDSIKEFVVGRYALHFHHCMNGSRGSIVEECVGYDMGSHVFVPHVSDGITFKNCVSFNSLETPYWWDKGDISNEIIFDGCVAALSKFVNGAGSTPIRRSLAFFLGMGDDNECINCVSVAGSLNYTSNGHTTGAYLWDEGNEGVWKFENCLSHSDFVGIRSWQNTHKNHVILNFDSYNNLLAIFHGAYFNSYTYRGGYHYNSILETKASSSNTSGVRFEHITIDGANKVDYPVVIYDAPVQVDSEYQTNRFLFCTVKNYKVGPVLGTSIFLKDSDSRKLKNADFICCDLGGKLPTYDAYAENGCWMRVQPLSGQSKKIQKVGPAESNKGSVKVTDIAAFAPTIWGMGDGLKGSYFANCVAFKPENKVFDRIDSLISFKEWTKTKDTPNGVHYKIPGVVYCMRWSGKIMAQYSEEYKFRSNSAGATRIWVGGKLILDAWQSERRSTTDEWALYTESIKLVAGQSYDIKIEFRNEGGYEGFLLSWMCPSMKEYHLVPQSQLFSGVVVNPPQTDKPAENKTPTAVAGDDVEITLPTNSITLNGSGSTDPDGKIASYKWSKVSGPTQFTIANSTAMITNVTNLVAGTYVFQLQVKDDKDAVSTDTISITIKPEKESENNAPVANAGQDVTISLPTNNTTLNGSSSSDKDGKIVSYKWSKISGPSKFSIVSAASVTTVVNNLEAGVYVFQLEVEDDRGAKSKDQVTVTVQKTAQKETAPQVNAGSDINISLPTNNVRLSGTVKATGDSSIKSQQWIKVSGPSKFNIVSPRSVNTNVNQLVAGTYVFELQAIDTNGLSGKDQIKVVVAAKETNTIDDSASSKLPEELNVSVSPNPSTSVFRVNVNSNSDKPITLKLYDKWGVEVGSIKNVKKGSTVTIPSTLKKGTYFGVAEQGFQKKTMTLIKM